MESLWTLYSRRRCSKPTAQRHSHPHWHTYADPDANPHSYTDYHLDTSSFPNTHSHRGAIAFPHTIPTLNHYGIWVPCAIDQPLPLARPGDTMRFTLDGLEIQAIFAPGHSFDTVVYVLHLAGQRVFLTGDIGFHGDNHILNRCWGDEPNARSVMKTLREQVLPLKPEFVLTGHDEHTNGIAFWEGVTPRERRRLAQRRKPAVAVVMP